MKLGKSQKIPFLNLLKFTWNLTKPNIKTNDSKAPGIPCPIMEMIRRGRAFPTHTGHPARGCSMRPKTCPRLLYCRGCRPLPAPQVARNPARKQTRAGLFHEKMVEPGRGVRPVHPLAQKVLGEPGKSWWSRAPRRLLCGNFQKTSILYPPPGVRFWPATVRPRAPSCV